jgi:ankyrin repeat protein
LLLKRSPSVDFKDEDGCTPLFWAMRFDHLEIVKLLFSSGANPNSKDNRYSRTLLSWLAERGQYAMIKVLLENNARVDATDNEHGRTLLSRAVEKGHKGAATILLANGAYSNSMDDYNCWTPLMLSAQGGHEPVVKLTNNGAEIDMKDNDSRRPLSRAAERGYNSVVRLLIEMKAGINIEDNIGWTLLTWAIKARREAARKLLVENGARTQPVNDSAVTAGADIEVYMDVEMDVDMDDMSSISSSSE